MRCADEMSDHHGQEAGLKYIFDSSILENKWTFGSESLLCQEFRRSAKKRRGNGEE